MLFSNLTLPHRPAANRPPPLPPLAVVHPPSVVPVPPGANIVHLRREPTLTVDGHALLRAGVTKSEASIPLADPDPAAAALAAPLASVAPALAAAVAADVALLARAVGETLGAKEQGSVRAKLEVVTVRSCPRFHADAVGCRALVTYCGAGTLYAHSAAVARSPPQSRWDAARGVPPTPAVAGVDPAAVVQVAPFDVLLLRGGGHPAARGGPDGPDGAVHASPHADEGAPRLLLTVDDIVAAAKAACGGGGAADGLSRGPITFFSFPLHFQFGW